MRFPPAGDIPFRIYRCSLCTARKGDGDALICPTLIHYNPVFRPTAAYIMNSADFRPFLLVKKLFLKEKVYIKSSGYRQIEGYDKWPNLLKPKSQAHPSMFLSAASKSRSRYTT